MGQCSTLPAEGRGTSSSSVRFDGVFQQSNNNNNNANNSDYHASRQEQRHRLRDDGRKESFDFNALVTPEHAVGGPQPQKHHHSSSQHHHHHSGGSSSHHHHNMPPNFPRVMENNNTNHQHGHPSSSRRGDHMMDQPQARDPEGHIDDMGHGHGEPEPMDVDSREEAPAPIPQPPENAVRTRCYKLNLESKALNLSSTQKQNMWLGPFVEPPPHLTYSSSEDSSDGISPTTVAIKTAQIFRGITVSRDGTILTQNARATRSNRGNKTKKGEKSRQAAKIDKAKDLVEECITTGKVPDSDEPANMVSLVIVGEYDDMKHLVRDGSKKLREASDLPDEALLSINRPRATPSRSKSASASLGTSSKKRVSPTFINSQRSAAQQSPGKVQITSVPAGVHHSSHHHQTSPNHPASVHHGQSQATSSPPKLKVHPRDNRPGRREDRAGMRMRLDSCPPSGAVVGDGDWSHAWNIWNCGGTGTVSPLQPSSPKDAGAPAGSTAANTPSAAPPGGTPNSKVVFEERRDINQGSHRETGVSSRAT